VIVDWNGIQGSGFTKDILPLEGIGKIVGIMGWNSSIVDGHSIGDLSKTLSAISKKPEFIIADTVKGKGVSFMENKPEWHAKWLDGEQEKQAYAELQ
jgi:transketolase